MGIHTRCDTAVAWFYEKPALKLMLAVYESLGVRVTWEKNRDYNGTWYTVRVVDRADAWRAREIRRGLKVAATLRGDVYDFLEGLRAGLIAAGKVKASECGNFLNVSKRKKLLPASTERRTENGSGGATGKS